MKLLALALVLSTAAGTGAFLAPDTHLQGPSVRAGLGYERIPAASWAPRDTADTLWRRGRIAISDEAWSDAAEAFRRLVERYPKSAYAGDALYWEAFALQRVGGRIDLRRAASALEQQKNEYPKAATVASGESATLLARVNGRLARSGDAGAAESVVELATKVSEVTAVAVSTALTQAARELERELPRVQQELNQASRELSREQRELAREQAELARESQGGRRRSEGSVPEGCVSEEDDERVEALNALLHMNSEQTLPMLRRVLERRDKCSVVLRRKAVFLVSQQRSDEAVDIMLNAAKTDPDPEVREQAVFWLGQTRSPRAVEVLEQILVRESPDEELQKKALFALSQNRTERAQTILRDFAKRKDVDEEVRGEAIFWLGQGRGEQNATFLREIFATVESQELQEKVIFSISQSRSDENSRFLLGVAKNTRLSAEIRKSALFWAGQSGVPVRDIADIYDTAGEDRELREQVIFVLSQKRNDTAAADKLLDIARREPDRELRKNAIFWLGQSRDPRVIKALEDIISRP